MKLKIQLLMIITVLCTYNIYGQIRTDIIDILVNNQTTISNCFFLPTTENPQTR